LKPKFLIRYRVKVWPRGEGYWLEFPDFPSLSRRDKSGETPAETLAADTLAHEIVDLLYQQQSLPMPTPRQDGELYVEPRFHYPPMPAEELV
jgi:predicted RNase H-like HicB family nuclease